MKFKLKDITTIQTGTFARPENSGDLVYLQAKYFELDGSLKEELIPDLNSNSINQRHILNQGDVLFAAKGSRNFAVVYEAHFPPAVASTVFFVLKSQTKIILPSYLAYYLNSPTVQATLKNHALGTNIPSISKPQIEELDIAVPNLEKQQQIDKINQLLKREETLTLQLLELKKKYISRIIESSLNKK